MKRALIIAVSLWLGMLSTAHGQDASACPFGSSISADLTAFGCASDPLAGPTYQIPAGGANFVRMVPTGGAPNATSAASGAGSGVSSSASCPGTIPSTAGSAGAGDLLGC